MMVGAMVKVGSTLSVPPTPQARLQLLPAGQHRYGASKVHLQFARIHAPLCRMLNHC